MPLRFSDDGAAWRRMCSTLVTLGVFPRTIHPSPLGFVFAPHQLSAEVLELIDACERAGCEVER